MNHYHLDDTIVAIASAAGGAARGILRLSGPRAQDCLADCYEPAAGTSPQASGPASVVEGTFLLDDARLPCDLFWWPDNRSFTRQPTAELHTLGSPPLLALVVETLCRRGARMAEPGEFTLRAFLAGRLDLTQAEAVLGIIDARSESQFDAAVTQLAGGLSGPLAELREQLLAMLAELEAGLDFVDEPIEFLTDAELRSRLHAAQEVLFAALQQLHTRDAGQGLPRVVLAGPPNVGKSSLFNALVADQAASAIVAPQAGTTRDYVTAQISIEGVALELIDTAGEDSLAEWGAIDAAVQHQTAKQRQTADLILRCREIGSGGADNGGSEKELVLLTKCDQAETTCSPAAILCSSLTGVGIEQLKQAIRQRLSGDAEDCHGVAATAIRCRESLASAGESLREAAQLADRSGYEELVAAEIRAALNQLGQVVGAVYTDDILDRIFSNFCIGK